MVEKGSHSSRESVLSILVYICRKAIVGEFGESRLGRKTGEFCTDGAPNG